jgi:hypothetical protein
MAFDPGSIMYGNFWDRADWYYKFAWWPHRCEISKKRIWLIKAYKGIQMITGPGDPVFIIKWLTKEQYMWARLKGTI